MNISCSESGLDAPKVCPDGMVCVAVYMPPFPSPPGYYIEESPSLPRDTFMNCTLGEYCNLGRYNGESRECPAGAYCSDPDVMFPKACSCDTKNYTNCSYCPEGSSWDQPCPAGFYCEGPTNMTACYQSEYHVDLQLRQSDLLSQRNIVPTVLSKQSRALRVITAQLQARKSFVLSVTFAN